MTLTILGLIGCFPSEILNQISFLWWYYSHQTWKISRQIYQMKTKTRYLGWPKAFFFRKHPQKWNLFFFFQVITKGKERERETAKIGLCARPFWTGESRQRPWSKEFRAHPSSITFFILLLVASAEAKSSLLRLLPALDVIPTRKNQSSSSSNLFRPP